MCDPVPTQGAEGSVPAHRAKVLPTASSRTSSPTSSQRDLIQVRAFRSVGVNTTRVTAAGPASEKAASSSISELKRCWSSVSFIECRLGDDDSSLYRSNILLELFRWRQTTAGTRGPSI